MVEYRPPFPGGPPPFPGGPSFTGRGPMHPAWVADSHPVSAFPDVRAGMETFFAALNDQHVATALEKVYTQPPSDLDSYPFMTENLLNGVLRPEMEERERYSSVNARGFITELLIMNHPNVWRQLLEVATRDAKVVAALNQAFQFTPGHIGVLGEKISDGNMSLFGKTLVYTGLALIYGSEFQYHVQDNSDKQSTRFPVGMAIGNHFGSRAATPAHTVERLREIFPHGVTDQSGLPVWNVVKKNDAFNNYNRSTKSGMTVCPGQDITASLFRGFGNLLLRDDIRWKFVQSGTPGRRF